MIFGGWQPSAVRSFARHLVSGSPYIRPRGIHQIFNKLFSFSAILPPERNLFCIASEVRLNPCTLVSSLHSIEAPDAKSRTRRPSCRVENRASHDDAQSHVRSLSKLRH